MKKYPLWHDIGHQILWKGLKKCLGLSKDKLSQKWNILSLGTKIWLWQSPDARSPFWHSCVTLLPAGLDIPGEGQPQAVGRAHKSPLGGAQLLRISVTRMKTRGNGRGDQDSPAWKEVVKRENKTLWLLVRPRLPVLPRWEWQANWVWVHSSTCPPALSSQSVGEHRQSLSWVSFLPHLKHPHTSSKLLWLYSSWLPI